MERIIRRITGLFIVATIAATATTLYMSDGLPGAIFVLIIAGDMIFAGIVLDG